ncbi:MAG: PAS domain S-box protein [Desulfuromonadaceae bacterium]|nr:PAS domain S-box protein [Desulfuromonadaceae bacterium]
MNALISIPSKICGIFSKICRHVLSCLLLILIVSTAAHCGGDNLLTPEEHRWLNENKSRIVLAVETGYPPYTFLDSNGKPSGLAYDYLLKLESKLGVNFSQKQFSSLDEIFSKARNGEVQIVNAVTKTPARSEFLSFTEPFISVPNVIVVRKGRPGKMLESHLSGLKVSLVKSYAVTEYLLKAETGLIADIVPNDLAAILNVSFGQSDAAVIDLATASYLIFQKGITNLRVAGEASHNIQLSMAVPRSETVLLSILQKGLNSITEAERHEIRDKWVHSPKKDIFSDWRFWVVVGGSLCVICLLIIGSIIWNRMLRGQVALRTSELAKEQEALRQSESRHRVMVESITDVIAIIDRNGINKYKSPNIEKLFGWRRDEVVGQTTFKHIHPDDLAAEQKNFTDLLCEANRSITSEFRYQCKDGSYKWIEHTATNLLHDPDISGVLVGYHDISERKKAEKALWKEKAFLRSLIDSAVDLIYFKDVNGVYLGCNKASESFTGISERDQIGKTDYDLFDKELAEHIVTHDKQVLKGGAAVHLEESVMAADGNRLILDTVKTPIFGQDGHPIGHVGISRDITRQKREEQLAAARLHLVEYSLSHSLDELLTATLDQIEVLTGSMIGYFHLLQEDQRTLTLHAWSTQTAGVFCKAEGTGSHYDIDKAGVWVDCIHQRQPVIHNDYASLPHRKGMPPGHASVVRELAVPIFRSDKIMGVLGIGNKDTEYTNEDVQIASRFADLVWDIAERRQIQESLHESNELFTAAFNCAPIMITISSIEDGTCLDANQQFLNISGFSREEVIGKTSVELGWISQTDRMQLKESIQQQGKIVNQEISLHTKSGQTKLCKYWGEVISVAGHKQLLSIALDITEQHKAEQQLQQAQKMESIGSLAGGVAHDFNNLLTVIIGHAQLGLMELDTDHPVCNNLKEIFKMAERSADLTRQLLAFARKQAISPKTIDLNEVIDGILKMLRRLIGEDIHLAWHPAPGLWLIKADPSQLDQILANLCVNARDAIKGTGLITIETRNNTVDSSYCEGNPDAVPGEYVHLSVSDDGSGMDKETMARVFEPFFTTKGIGEGTGLGLSTVYGIVKQNNGFINIYSEPGKGTTFTIHLPRIVEERQKTPTEANAAPLPEGQETILVVEDESAILYTTSQLLGMLGYTILRAGTPGEAMRLAHEHAGEINLLITDVIMPEMNGKDLANRLQTMNPQLKCLFMSGYTSDIIAQHGVLDEGVCFIQKPFALPNLAAKVREVLG